VADVGNSGEGSKARMALAKQWFSLREEGGWMFHARSVETRTHLICLPSGLSVLGKKTLHKGRRMQRLVSHLANLGDGSSPQWLEFLMDLQQEHDSDTGSSTGTLFFTKKNTRSSTGTLVPAACNQKTRKQHDLMLFFL
jgi:hypothetical protein